jgi:hypothetical protein
MNYLKSKIQNLKLKIMSNTTIEEKAKKLGNEPAFPTIEFAQNRQADTYCPFETSTGLGLTKREYFAGLAMQALLITCKNNYIIGDAVSRADDLLIELVKDKKSCK